MIIGKEETMKGNSQFSTVKSQLPKGWEIKKLGEVCENLDRQRIPIEKNKRVAGVVPYYGASGIVDYVEGYLFDEELLCVSEDGANLLARTYPIAFSIQGKTWVNNHAHVLRFANKSTQNFVKLYINFIKIDKYVSGMAQPKLNQKKLNSILIPLPPLAEQQRIVAKLDALFAKIQALETKTKQNLENAKELFKSYLQGVFENKGNNWEEKKLKDIGIVQTGTTPPTKDKANYGDYIPFVKPSHFTSEGNIEVEKSMLSEQGLKKGRLIQEKSILMVCIGATIGKTSYTPIRVSSNQQINSLTPNNNYYAKFFYYTFISSFFQKQVLIEGQSAQATLPIINKTKWGNLKVVFPRSIAEQQRITEKLDVLSLKTKQLESIYQEKLLLLAELKKSILDKAFKGEL